MIAVSLENSDEPKEPCCGEYSKKTSEVLLINDFGRYSCGGRTRTCDLQVMSLASYQLLHSAMFSCFFLFAGAKVLLSWDITKFLCVLVM